MTRHIGRFDGEARPSSDKATANEKQPEKAREERKNPNKSNEGQSH